MKRIFMASILSFVLLFAFGPLVTQAGAESMTIKLVSMVEKLEVVKVSGLEGTVIGVIDRKGLSTIDNGDIATMACRGIFDTKKGFQGYSTLTFEDGSTIVLAWKGPTSRLPKGGKFSGYSGTFEYAKGTGRFEGIKGSGTWNGKGPEWDKDFKAKGFMYYEFTGPYELSSK